MLQKARHVSFFVRFSIPSSIDLYEFSAYAFLVGISRLSINKNAGDTLALEGDLCQLHYLVFLYF